MNGLTCPADPAGVSHLALQSTCTRWFFTKMTQKQQSLRKKRLQK
ncbi:hypothetical protein [Pseudalkalibacillus sp. R45]